MSVTYANALLKVQRDLDLEEEVFVQSAEMMEYFNEALRQAEAEVLSIYEDYFLAKETLTLVSGTSLYALPTSCYAHKIRRIIYKSGSKIYEIKRLQGSNKFIQRALLIDSNPTDSYMYMILKATDGHQIELIPPAQESSSSNVTIFFIKKVDVIDATSDVVDKDIPESIDFIYAYVKARCKQKENGGVMPQDAAQELEYQKKLFIETLTNMVPDDDNVAEQDHSFYVESS